MSVISPVQSDDHEGSPMRRGDVRNDAVSYLCNVWWIVQWRKEQIGFYFIVF